MGDISNDRDVVDPGTEDATCIPPVGTAVVGTITLATPMEVLAGGKLPPASG